MGHSVYRSKKIRFQSKDDLEKVKKNPTEWALQNIVYDYNRHGFRCKNFKDINWAESIVVLGCSITTGVGLAEQDTVTSRIESITGIPTINLGISGSAVDLACWNSLILHNHFPRPKAIVHLWTQLDRYTNLTRSGLTSYNANNSDYIIEHDWGERSKFYIKTDRELWKDKTKYVEASFFKHTALTMNIPGIEMVDEAEDAWHPGKETIKLMAKLVCEKL